jgi:AAA-like domain
MDSIPSTMRLRGDCQDLALQALNTSNYDGQKGLGQAANIAQATVSHFFNCKPIRRGNFKRLCELLKIDFVAVAESPQSLLHQPISKAPQNIDRVFYVPRSSDETWYQQLLQPYSLVRIQAPSQFGKTELMLQMLDRARADGFLTLYINLESIFNNPAWDDDRFLNTDRFQILLREFVTEIETWIDTEYPEQINALMSLAEYEIKIQNFGFVRAYLKYLEHLQKQIGKPVILTIDKLDRLLEYPDVARRFLSLLRDMNEKSKVSQTWRKFRLLLAHSTPHIKEFVEIALDESPFNVGYILELPEFTPLEVKKLFQLSQLNLDDSQIAKLMQWLGGIPSLLILTIQTIRTDGIQTLDPIIAGDTDRVLRIYQVHLVNLKENLNRHGLLSLMQQVVRNHGPTPGISLKQRCLLHRRGLVVFANHDRILPRCELYRAYFANQGFK